MRIPEALPGIWYFVMVKSLMFVISPYHKYENMQTKKWIKNGMARGNLL